QALGAAEKAFDRLPREQQVKFVDRMKAGADQPTSELRDLAKFMTGTDEDTYMRVVEAQVRSLGPKEQELWNELSREEKAAFVHNLEKFRSATKEAEKGGRPTKR